MLLEAARRLLIEVPLAEAGPGALILFRLAASAPAKQCGILGAAMLRPSFSHAHEGAGVIEEPLTEPWLRRAAYAFLYPAEA